MSQWVLQYSLIILNSHITVHYRYSSSYESVEALVLEAIKEQIQRRAAPDAIGKGFLKLLSATCGFPEVRNQMIYMTLSSIIRDLK